jgi:KDO2-lipid IV(A) lauroyltransferase
MAFPNQKHNWRRRILRESFLRVADHFVEVCRLPRVSADELERRIFYEPGHGLEHYEAARAGGKGVIFLTGHIGPWELLPLAHAVLGNPLNVVVRPLDNPFVDRWMTRVRSRFGNRVINKSSSLRQILRLLGRGEDVGMLIDQNVQEKDGVFVPFFGHTACTTVSPAALALRTKTPVVIGFLLPTRRRRRYRIRFYPPIEVNASEDRDSDLARYTTLFNRYIEEVITEHPDCWLWGHRRFRTQPDGSDPY